MNPTGIQYISVTRDQVQIKMNFFFSVYNSVIVTLLRDQSLNVYIFYRKQITKYILYTKTKE